MAEIHKNYKINDHLKGSKNGKHVVLIIAHLIAQRSVY